MKLELPISNQKVGLGLIHFNLNEAIPLFKTENYTKPYDTLHFIEKKDGPDKGICIFKTNLLGQQLKPYIMNEGDSEEAGREHINMGLIRFSPEIAFRVIQKIENGVVCIINEETMEISFIKIDPKNDLRKNIQADSNFFDPNFTDSQITNWYHYETWGQLIKRAYGIGIGNDATVYDKPDGNIIKIENATYFKVDSVQNYWARLINQDYYLDNEKKIYGWVKWNYNDSIKLHMTLNGGYE